MVKSGQLPGIDTLSGTPTFCEACTPGEMKKLPFELQDGPCTPCPLEMVHTDVGGPITPKSQEGYRYWIVIVGNFTYFPWVYFMTYKSETLGIYNQWKTDIKTLLHTEIGQEDLSESHVKFIRSDSGTEYTNKVF